MTSLPVAGIARSKTSMRPEGRATGTHLELVASEVPAACPGGEASSLPEVEGEAVVVRRMIRYVDGEPWSIQDSSYPMDIAQQAGLLVPHDLPEGTVRAMAEHGHVEIGYRDELTTRMPTPDETQTLDLAAGVPILAYIRTCYTKERPVRLTETIFAGDRNRLVYELGDLEALYERDE
jgi:GntR family transcriptional regulator